MSVIVCSSQSQKMMVENFGTTVYGNIYTPTYIRFNSYVTKESIVDPVYKYKYEIIVVSNSSSNGQQKNLYMTNINVFANNMSISGQQYPTGFWAIIPPNQEFVLYWYKTNEEQVHFSYNWSNIQFY
jgi:hypothetical protein